MGAYGRGLAGYFFHDLESLTLTGANESLRAIVPSGVSIPLLQANFLTENFAPNDLVWVPVGVSYVITTGITVTNAVVTIRKNGVGPIATPATAGQATLPIAALGANELFAPFTNYAFAAAPAPGDAWSVLVTTTSTAGVVTLFLCYAYRTVAGITDGVGL